MLSHTREMYFSCEQCNYSCKLSLQKDSVKTNALKQATFPPLTNMTYYHLLMVIPMGKKRKALPIWFSAANSSDTGRPLNS